MHDAAYLHIRARNSRATRIVSLTEASVRIGRGRSCEVRLDDPALAEVECLLRRRGNTWHLQPVEASSTLTLDGRPADAPRPVPMGSTLRLADRWLTLLPTMDAPDLDPDPDPTLPPEEQVVIASEPEPQTRPQDEQPPESSSDPLDQQKAEVARLEARLKQRERWLKDRLHERQWEARWRAAGASIKNRERPVGQPEPKVRASSAPLRPTVTPEPSLRARREPVAPVAPRYQRPTPSEPPSYPTPANRTQPKAAPRPSSIEDEATCPEVAEPPMVEAPPQSRALRVTQEIVPVETLLRSTTPDPELASESGEPTPLEQKAEEPSPQTAESLLEASLLVEAEGVEPGPIAVDEQDDPVAIDDQEDATATSDAIEPIDGMIEALAADRLEELEPAPDPTETPAVEGLSQVEVETPGDPIALDPAPSEEPADPARSTCTELAIPWEGPSLAIAEPLACVDTEQTVEPASPVEKRPKLGVPMIGLSELVSFLSRKPSEVTQTTEPEPEPEPEPLAAPEPAVENHDAPVENVAEPTEPRAETPAAPEPIEDPSEPIEPFVPEASGNDEPEPIVTRSGDWPSAKAILTAQPDRERARSRPAARNRAAARLPLPTDRIAPAGWTVPGGSWLCIPLMFVAVAVGAVGLRLSWTWAVVDRETGRLADQLADGKRPEGTTLELSIEREQELPPAKWWNSTSDQMIMRAALLSGQGVGFDPANQERAGDLLHAASGNAPGHPSLRFAKAWRALQEPGVDPAAAAVGLSRDVWSLSWTGRALLAKGNVEAAKRVYRSALEMACRAQPDPSARPTFHSEPRGGRFGLPLEDLINVVVLDMANRPEWSTEDWQDVLPDVAEVWLVAARLLRNRGDSAAEAALDRAIALGEEPAPSGCSTALHEAASAEALALAGRFDEAAERYQSAVEHLSKAEEPARRSWMFNLAELYGRTGKSSDERSCLLASMTTDPNDPVTSEAIRIQLRRGMSLVGTEGGEGDGTDLSVTARPLRSRTLGE